MFDVPEHNQHIDTLFPKTHDTQHLHHVHAKVDMSKESLLKSLQTLRGSVKSGKESISALSGSVLGLRGSTAYESLNTDSILASNILTKFLKHVDKIVKLVNGKDVEHAPVQIQALPIFPVYYTRRRQYNEFI